MPSISLKLKLTFSAILIGVLLLIAQTFSQFYFLRGELAQRIEHEQFTLLSELARHLDNEIGERLHALEEASKTISVDQLQKIEVIESHLQRETALLSLFDDLYIFNTQGTLLVDWPARPGRRQLDMSGRDYIKGVQETLKPIISQPVLGKATQQPIVVLAVPVLDDQGS